MANMSDTLVSRPFQFLVQLLGDSWWGAYSQELGLCLSMYLYNTVYIYLFIYPPLRFSAAGVIGSSSTPLLST